MTRVDYKDLKPVVIKACSKVGKYTNDFKVDIDKLNTSLESLNLVALPVGLEGERVTPEDLYAIAEYFNGENLKWFENSKFISTLICVDKDDINEEVQLDIDKLYVKPEDDPDLDYVSIVANIIASLHCYYAMIVSYNSNDPGRAGKNTYYINCRANKVVLKDPEYVYNSKDIG